MVLTFCWGRIDYSLKIEVKWQALIVISIGIFMSTLDGSILNIANPSIAKSLHVSMQQVQWLVTAYMLIITASLIFLGRLGDQLGSHKIYTYGFLIFTLGSFLCSISPALAYLISARLLQGVGASMMMATGMGIVSNVFPSTERGKALGLTGMVVGIGNMSGPSLGGLLVAHYPWPVVFLINVPIGLLGFFLARKYLPSQAGNHEHAGHDITGTVTFALAIVILLYTLSVTDHINLILLGISMALLLAFYYIEKKSPHPMLDFALFQIKTFTAGNIMALAVYTTQTSVFFLLPFFMERMLGFSPDHSGLLMTITPVTMAITAPLAGSLSDKIGSRRILVLSLLSLTLSYLLFSRLNTQLNLFILVSGLILLGLGMGMFGSPNNSSILGSIPREKAGYVGGFMATNRNLSFTIGIAASVSIFSFVLNSSQKSLPYTQAYIHASNTVYLIAAGITLLAFVLVFFLNGHESKAEKEVKQGQT